VIPIIHLDDKYAPVHFEDDPFHGDCFAAAHLYSIKQGCPELGKDSLALYLEIRQGFC